MSYEYWHRLFCKNKTKCFFVLALFDLKWKEHPALLFPYNIYVADSEAATCKENKSWPNKAPTTLLQSGTICSAAFSPSAHPS